jgi:hypothetical protein
MEEEEFWFALNMHPQSHLGNIQDFHSILPQEINDVFSSVQFTDLTNPFPIPGMDG